VSERIDAAVPPHKIIPFGAYSWLKTADDWWKLWLGFRLTSDGSPSRETQSRTEE